MGRSEGTEKCFRTDRTLPLRLGIANCSEYFQDTYPTTALVLPLLTVSVSLSKYSWKSVLSLQTVVPRSESRLAAASDTHLPSSPDLAIALRNYVS